MDQNEKKKMLLRRAGALKHSIYSVLANTLGAGDKLLLMLLVLRSVSVFQPEFSVGMV